MKRITIAIFASATLLSGCGGSTVKQTLGIETPAPDEFKVVSRPPLSVPPQFNLVPPTIGDGTTSSYATDKQAESLITGKSAPASGETFILKNNADAALAKPVQGGPMVDNVGASSAESQFLQNAGAASADPMVRKTLTEEKIMKQEKQEEAGWWEVWSKTPDKKDTLVNAKGEAERIKQTQEDGKPVNAGDTPVVAPKDRGVLGRILGE